MCSSDLPAVSQDSAPVVVYTDPGLYDVLLEVRNAAGSASSIRNALVEVVPTPLARFTYEVDGRVVRFTNLSEGTDEFQWNFDDVAKTVDINDTDLLPASLGSLYCKHWCLCFR